MAEVENPIKMTEETVKSLEEAFSMDCSVEEACLKANISKQSYYNWIKSFPKMKERFDELRHKPFLLARTTIIKAIQENPQYAFEYMKRKKKDEFSERQELTGNDGKELKINLINYADAGNNDTLQLQPETIPAGVSQEQSEV